MALTETVRAIPWNPSLQVPTLEGVGDWLRGEVPEALRPLVPRSITVMRSPDASAEQADELVKALPGFAREELPRWLRRAERLVDLGLFEPAEIEAHLAARDDVHPWALCVTPGGGLGEFEQNSIPCVAVRNHAIAWLPTGEPGAAVSYLVTARAEGQGWDMDDLGHECGHATTFAIALCAQDGSVVDPMPEQVARGALGPNHLRKLHYTLAEGANAIVRGESRETATGFAVLHSQGELLAFLRWCEAIFPGLGFDRSLAAYEAFGQAFLPMESDVAFVVAAPFIRATHRLAGNLRRLGEPTLGWVG